MKYEIVYLSKNGSTQKVAQALMQVFPSSSCKAVDFSKEKPSEDADVYLVGFGIQRGACPYALLEWIEELEEKKILLFATGALAAFSDYHHKLESIITPFLPEHCEYLGLHLCQGKITREAYAYLESCVSNKDDASQNLMRLYTYSQTHPDAQDLQSACKFVQTVLNLHPTF